MPTTGLVLFKKANTSSEKAQQTVVLGQILEAYSKEDDTEIVSSSTAFDRHVELGGDWKNWADYALDTFDFFILPAPPDTHGDESGGGFDIGKGTYGIVEQADLDNILVYWNRAFYDVADIRLVDANNWKSCAHVDFLAPTNDE